MAHTACLHAQACCGNGVPGNTSLDSPQTEVLRPATSSASPFPPPPVAQTTYQNAGLGTAQSPILLPLPTMLSQRNYSPGLGLTRVVGGGGWRAGISSPWALGGSVGGVGQAAWGRLGIRLWTKCFLF